jgi:hypothetical protein
LEALLRGDEDVDVPVLREVPGDVVHRGGKRDVEPAMAQGPAVEPTFLGVRKAEDGSACDGRTLALGVHSAQGGDSPGEARGVVQEDNVVDAHVEALSKCGVRRERGERDDRDVEQSPLVANPIHE